MSFGTPPFISPVPDTPNGPSGNYNPFTGSVTTVPMPQLIPAPMDPVIAAPYSPGPYCFGLDRLICGILPATITLGKTAVTGGVEIPVQGFCSALTNTLCGVVTAIILLVILGIAFQGLLN